MSYLAKVLEFFRLSRRTWIWIGGLHLLALAAGVATGVGLMRELPGIGRMDVMSLSQVTVLEDRDGQPLHSYAEQKRVPVRLSEVSPWLIKAIVATEDPRFTSHFGIDPLAVGRAVLRNLSSNRRAEGASTITMQLARDEFLHRQKTFRRKVVEAVYATQIEMHYSKEDILTQYCNRIYLGHGRYGAEAAARHYFGKAAKDLDLAESALIAGLINSPERLTPYRYPERALRRRNHVLQRMVIEEVLDPAAAEEAMKLPVKLNENRPSRELAPHFVEQVRRWLVSQFGEETVYREGLIARTTLDARFQLAAERAVRWGLDQYGRRWKQIPEGLPLPEGTTPEDYEDPVWFETPRVDDIISAVVLSVDKTRALVRIADQQIELDQRSISWTGKKRISAVVKPETIIPVKIVKLDKAGRIQRLDLGAEPTAEAALVALDAATGEVLAHVGGRNFEKTQWDLAMQAGRQPGSAFKPFIFAAALENGFLPTDRIYDVPTVVLDAGSEPYQPENYELDYKGYVTLRYALEHSRNIPTVRLLDSLGYDPAVEMARRLGISSTLKPFPSLALGTFDTKLVNLVAAYAAFVNGGVLVKPQLIKEVRHSDQRQLYSGQPETKEVLSPEVSAQMVSLLEGIVLHGTGRGALALGRPVGGKTGTTDDFNNALFVGFTPSIAVGVWVGHVDNSILGKRETGARAALPIWTRFLGDALAGEPVVDFVRPPGVSRSLVDSWTGLRAPHGAPCEKVILETFKRNEEPLNVCNTRENIRTSMPYPLQRYPISPRGELLLPPGDAARLVTAAPGRLSVVNRGRSLRWSWGKKQGSIPLNWSFEDTMTYYDDLAVSSTSQQLLRDEEARFREEFAEELEKEAANLKARDEEPPEIEDVLPARFRKGKDGWPAYMLETNRSGQVRRPTAPVDPDESSRELVMRDR